MGRYSCQKDEFQRPSHIGYLVLILANLGESEGPNKFSSDLGMKLQNIITFLGVFPLNLKKMFGC